MNFQANTQDNKFTVISAEKTNEELALEVYATVIQQTSQMVEMLKSVVEGNHKYYVMEAEGVYLSSLKEVCGINGAEVFETEEEARATFGNVMNGNRVLFTPREFTSELLHQIKMNLKVCEDAEKVIEGKKVRTYTRKTAVESMKDEMQNKQNKEAKQEKEVSTLVTADEKMFVSNLCADIGGLGEAMI